MGKCCFAYFSGVLLGVSASAGFAQGGASSPGETWVGEVTGADVYVRSGPSSNYYPVTKLTAGVRVRVHGDTDGWLPIEPPAGCFSLIHKDFVDVSPDVEGSDVVNGDAVLVRAGSSLSEDLYAKQLKLSKGATVIVLGPHNDDYLKIAPPEGARLYISRGFVARVPASRLAAEPEPTATTAATPEAKSTTVESTPPADTTEPVEQSAPGCSVRAELAEVDAALEAEEKKPFMHRDYGALITFYRRIADQEDDASAAGYAKTRIAQLERASETLSMVKGIRTLGDELATQRKNSLQRRERMRPPFPVIGGGFDVVGELRESMIYGPGTVPRRLRLMGDDRVRTIGYVEIPEESNLDVSSFLGRRVGIRARGQRLQAEGVDPLVIYTAGEVVVLDSGGKAPGSSSPDEPRR